MKGYEVRRKRTDDKFNTYACSSNNLNLTLFFSFFFMPFTFFKILICVQCYVTKYKGSGFYSPLAPAFQYDHRWPFVLFASGRMPLTSTFR